MLIIVASSNSEPLLVDCKNGEEMTVAEGDSLWFVPEGVLYGQAGDHEFSWYQNISMEVLPVSTEETERVHSHGSVLRILNASTEHTGCYMARQENTSGEFLRDHFIDVRVVPVNSSSLWYSPVVDSNKNIKISCPIKVMCRLANGTLSWEKEGVPFVGEHENYLWIMDAKPEDQGLYDCVCTWSHHQGQYRTSGSKQLRLREPTIYGPLDILSPTTEEQLAEAGGRLLLNCTVFFGTNIPLKHCEVQWKVGKTQLDPENLPTTYNLTTHVTRPSKKTIVTKILTIEKVSPEDFEKVFQCVGVGYYKTVNASLCLRPTQSMVPLVATGACVFILVVFIALMVKWFAIDLTLLSRQLFPFKMGDNDSKVFDAYVVYQLQTEDKNIEDGLGRFVSQDLPKILEDKCGYKLFIHGRDDLPGEDRLELVEERMRKSRRLIVILTPGSGSEISETYHQPEGYDWQVGLHQALVQRDLSVILIQLGDTGPGGYSHLPPGLQHLIQRSAPIRWPQDSRAARVNSRFWKRVRYLMPATPVTRYHVSVDI